MARNCTRRLIGFVAAFSAFLSLTLATPAWAVPVISISETTEGSLLLSVSEGIDIDGASLAIDPETVSFSAVLHIPFGDGVLFAAPYSFVLLEPGGGTSDVATVTTPLGLGGSGSVDWEQSFTFSFTSADGLISPPEPYCELLETGSVQSCSIFSQTDAEILRLEIASDIDIPEPSILALFAAGLAGLGALHCRRKAKA